MRPFSKTCVARVEGGVPPYALPEPMYIGNHRPALRGASVSRKVEPREFPMLEAARAQQLLEAKYEVRQLESATA